MYFRGPIEFEVCARLMSLWLPFYKLLGHVHEYGLAKSIFVLCHLAIDWARILAALQ